MTRLELDPLFGFVLLEVVLIGIQVVSEGMWIGPIRKRLFNKQFYEKNFPELTKDKSIRLPEAGYPDMGGGLFSQKLSVQDWMTFANAQRAHYNYIEGVASIITFLLISGLFRPRFTVIMGAIYIIGRIFYGIGYRRGGSRGRMMGVLLVDIALLTTFASAIYGAFTFGGGVDGLKAIVGM